MVVVVYFGHSKFFKMTTHKVKCDVHFAKVSNKYSYLG